MAFPNPADIVAFNDEYISSQVEPPVSSYPEQRPESGGYPPLEESKALSGSSVNANANWTSKPFLFIGEKREDGTAV
jgi:hypothetical protein